LISPLYFIVGPTCIGKSAFAIKLAKKLNAQIINADSMQVYKDLTILTARPNTKETNKVKHHLFGYVKSTERYNVAKWCEEASKKINNLSKSKIPCVFVGGTGMYIDKLINGLVDIPHIPEIYKKKSENFLLKEGIENFYNIIKNFDNKALEKVNKNDVNRLKRIWEVFMYTNIPMSEWIKNRKKKFLNDPEYLLYLFLPDRKINYERVNNRFVEMINNGAVDEVKKILKLKLNRSLPIMRAHGVPEIELYLEKKIDLQECIRRGQQVTRNYVKRQHTWWSSTSLRIHQQIINFPDEICLKSINIS
tara:strand:+ start:117 stop:1034 length:918 start_codon:yes stop_codon:yes gene_type:complete